MTKEQIIISATKNTGYMWKYIDGEPVVFFNHMDNAEYALKSMNNPALEIRHIRNGYGIVVKKSNISDYVDAHIYGLIESAKATASGFDKGDPRFITRVEWHLEDKIKAEIRIELYEYLRYILKERGLDALIEHLKTFEADFIRHRRMQSGRDRIVRLVDELRLEVELDFMRNTLKEIQAITKYEYNRTSAE